MGGSESKKKLINEKINLRHDRLNIPDIDQIFEKVYFYAKDCEIIRCQFLPKWNDFMRKSGAIVLTTPNFDSAIQGMLWKFGIDFKGNVFNCEINEDEPYLTFKDSSLLRNDDIAISSSFTDLCKFWKLKLTAVDTLEKDFQKQADNMNFLNKDQENLLSERGIAPIDIFSHLNKLNLNVRRIKLAYMIIASIKDMFEEISRGLRRYARDTRDPAEMKRYEIIVKQAIEKKLTRPPRIVYQFSKENKVTTYEDHFDANEDDLTAEKYAQKFLESYVPSTERVPVHMSKSLVVGPMLTDKERKLSQGEIERERLLTRTTMATRQVTEERPKVIAPVETLTKESPPIFIYDQKFSQTQVIDNSKLKLAKTEYKKEEPLIAPDEPFIVEPEKHLLAQSIQLQEETIRKEEMARLRLELEDLRKQNELLTDKLSLAEEKERNPLKFPVYIKHHVPLKSWSLNLKKSVSASEQQKIEVIESAADYDYIIAGGDNGQIIFWKFVGFASIFEAKTMKVHEGPVKALLYLNDGKTLFSGGKDGKLVKCDISIFSTSVIEGGAHGAIRAFANPYDGFSILAACDYKIVSYDFISNKILWIIEAHEEAITDIVYNQQREIVLSASKDKKIKIWNLSTKECLGVLQGNLDVITSICCAYTPEFIYIVSISKDCFITFWNMSDKNLTKSYKMSSIAKKVMYLSDKKTVCTVHQNGMFTLWSIEKGENRDFSNGTEAYTNGCYYDDGHNVILSTANGMLEFWHSR